MLATKKIQMIRAALLMPAAVLLLPCLASAAQEKKIAPGSLISSVVVFQYAVYFLPAPSKDPMVVLRTLLRAKPSNPKLISEPPKHLAAPVMTARLEKDVAHKYAPLDIKALQYSGRGISREQALALQNSKQALIMNFGHASAHVWGGLKAATEIVEKLARETNGLIWDGETREMFTPDEWRKRRIETWTGTIPNVTAHTTIHVYSTGEYVRAITLGMAKFGLPDVVVQDFSWSLNRNMGHLINAFCQLMAEGAKVSADGEYDLNFRAIKDSGMRERQVGSLKPNAAASVRLSFIQGTAEEGDPRNRLVEIGFDKYPGADVHARQEALLSSLFGWEDSIKRVKHDEEVIAASKRARAKLPALRKAFTAGLTPGEFIEVKAPFATPKGATEWMWVEITEWKAGLISGLLKNEPFYIPTLHGGQIVRVREDELFDYIRRYPDGRQEGNETGRIIEKMRGSVERNK